MATLSLDTPTLYVEHVPDYSTEIDANGLPQVNELPGHVYFGVVIDGVKVPLGRKATAGLLADVERVKAAAQAAADASAPPAPPGQ